MKLDHTEVVRDFEGEPLQDLGKAITFRGLVFMALNNTAPDERIGAEAKSRAFATCQKFFKGKRVNLTVDDAALIKERAAVILGPLAYGRLAAWLEGEPQTCVADDDDDDDVEDPEVAAPAAE